jgi:plasmid stabilization system protein ParE
VTVEIRFLDEAVAELDDAVLWYQQQRDGLGLVFLAALDRTLDSLQSWPRTAPLVPHVPEHLEVRQARVGRFPYYVAYLIVDDVATVVAMAHERRRPHYWSSRTES